MLILLRAINGDLDSRNCSPVFKPVFGIAVLRAASPWPISHSNPIAVVDGRALEEISGSTSIHMIVKGAEGTARFKGDRTNEVNRPSRSINDWQGRMERAARTEGPGRLQPNPGRAEGWEASSGWQ